MTSSAVYPLIRSAPAFQLATTPSGSKEKIAYSRASSTSTRNNSRRRLTTASVFRLGQRKTSTDSLDHDNRAPDAKIIHRLSSFGDVRLSKGRRTPGLSAHRDRCDELVRSGRFGHVAGDEAIAFRPLRTARRRSSASGDRSPSRVDFARRHDADHGRDCLPRRTREGHRFERDFDGRILRASVRSPLRQPIEIDELEKMLAEAQPG